MSMKKKMPFPNAYCQAMKKILKENQEKETNRFLITADTHYGKHLEKTQGMTVLIVEGDKPVSSKKG